MGDLRANLTLGSLNARHAIRFGAALAAGVAAYWLLGMKEHGFWIPLTILFVLRPGKEETFQRLILRALGTAAGPADRDRALGVVAGTRAPWRWHSPLATAFAYGLLSVQYALFTAAITVYAVLLADSLGELALRAAGQRAGATALGIMIAAAAFLLWPNPGKGERPLALPDPAR